jgi:hypothetical protein
MLLNGFDFLFRMVSRCKSLRQCQGQLQSKIQPPYQEQNPQILLILPLRKLNIRLLHRFRKEVVPQLVIISH